MEEMVTKIRDWVDELADESDNARTLSGKFRIEKAALKLLAVRDLLAEACKVEEEAAVEGVSPGDGWLDMVMSPLKRRVS